jgi:hypothetical protein
VGEKNKRAATVIDAALIMRVVTFLRVTDVAAQLGGDKSSEVCDSRERRKA